MLVYGRNVSEEYLKKIEKVRKIYLQTGFHDEKLILLIEKSKIPVIYRDKRELDQLANGVHQGIILDVVDFSYTDYHDFTESEDSFVIILDHLEDPHNLGAIIRTSEAAGVNGIIIPKDRGVTVNSTVIKTSTGAIDNIPISMVTNLNQTIQDLKKNGFWVVGTDMLFQRFIALHYVIHNIHNRTSSLVLSLQVFHACTQQLHQPCLLQIHLALGRAHFHFCGLLGQLYMDQATVIHDL